jgi:TRAP-type mannitol/chloroaromatic compound transport system permease large subunit
VALSECLYSRSWEEAGGAAADHMATIFKAAVNFMVLQWIGVGLCIIFPQIILWLPGLIYAGH